MGNEPLEQAKMAAEVIGALIQTAGDSPDVKQAGAEIGKAALTLAKSVNVVLLPLAAINFGYDKAKEYFSNKSKFEKEFSEKTNKILPEDVIEPKPSIAGPVLQGLAFSHDEPNLKEMYLNLLSNSMNRKKSSRVHPAFVEIIKQLSADEIYALNLFIKNSAVIPIVEIRRNVNDTQNFLVSKKHILNIFNNVTGVPVVVKNLDTYVENWIRLGLFSVDYDSSLSATDSYNWADNRPEYLEEVAKMDKLTTPSLTKGIFTRTALGREFAAAVEV